MDIGTYIYIAGLFDGEGSMCIQRYKPKDCQNIRYEAYCSLGISCKEITDLLQKTFGGSIYKECVPGRRTIYRWGIAGRLDVMNFLEKIMLHLRVKREQAKVLYDFCLGYKDMRSKSDQFKSQELQRRQEAYKKLCKLNAAGAAATTERGDVRENEATV